MFKKFISYYKPHIGLFLLDIFCALAVAGIDLVFPLGTRYILTENHLNEMIQSQDISIIVYIGLGLMVLYIIRMGFQFVISYWGHKMGAKIERDMRLDLFKKLQTLDHEYFDSHKTGVLMSNLTSHLHDISEMSHHVPEDIIISVIMFIGSFIILSTISLRLTLIIFIFVIILSVFSMWRRKKQRAAFNKVRNYHGELNSQIENSISGIQLTKAFNNEEFEINRFNDVNKLYELGWEDAYFQMGVFNGGNEFLISLLNLSVLVIGAIFVVKGYGVASQDLLTYFLYISFLTKPINRLVSSMQQTQQGISGFQKFYDIMNEEPRITNKKDCIRLENLKGDIDFKDVTFRYNNTNSDVLTNFNLNISHGQKVALIGETGVGKTTISKLIPRFYDVTSGEILIDNINIKDYELASLRENIGIVQQDVFMFYGTILDNILYGKPDATVEEIKNACISADIYDFIMSLENGFDTIIGERGMLLSGGQKQRIAIARMFLKNPKLIILDEATSSLDNETERIVQEAFDKLSTDHTIIIIAHRLTTIKNVDEIVVLGKDGIIEQGSPEELYQSKGKYFELLNK